MAKYISCLIGAVAICMGVVIGPSAAPAQDSETAGQNPRFIQRFDSDGDDRVSMDEFSKNDQCFDRLDANQDGYIDASEAPRGSPRGSRGGKHLARFDADQDGQLSMEEFPGPDERFSQLDIDGDGVLSGAELRKGRRGNKQ